MAAGKTTITIVDGIGQQRTVSVWSSNGGIGGTLSFLQALLGADGASLVGPGNPIEVAPGAYASTSLGYFQSTVTTAETLAGIAGGAIPAGSLYASVQAEQFAWRYRGDATAPVAAIGTLIPVGAPVLFSAQFAGKFISTQAGGILNVEFLK
jgi:hypothetical protein